MLICVEILNKARSLSFAEAFLFHLWGSHWVDLKNGTLSALAGTDTVVEALAPLLDLGA